MVITITKYIVSLNCNIVNTMTILHLASKKFLNSSFLSNTPSLGIGGPKNGTSYDRVTDTLRECYIQCNGWIVK